MILPTLEDQVFGVLLDRSKGAFSQNSVHNIVEMGRSHLDMKQTFVLSIIRCRYKTHPWVAVLLPRLAPTSLDDMKVLAFVTFL